MNGATIRRLWLCSELRKARERADLTAEEVAEQLDWSHSKISRMETGKVGLRATDVSVLCDVYGISGQRKELMVSTARQAKQRTWYQRDYGDVVADWFAQYVGLEGSAIELQMFEGLAVPGILQTRDYAEAVTRATLVDAEPDEIQRKVAFRMERQSILAQEDPPEIWAILDEGAVRREVGGPKIMRAQLDYLRELAERPKITLQVVPFNAGGHAAMSGPFVNMRFVEPFPPVVYLESQISSAYLQEDEDVRRYAKIFDHLQASALAPVASLDLLVEVAATM
jgi:transcriptional regulator with XRE-family HTH domain